MYRAYDPENTTEEKLKHVEPDDIMWVTAKR